MDVFMMVADIAVDGWMVADIVVDGWILPKTT
jgi:hypothetical protein